MKRSEWEFQKPAPELAEKAKENATYHLQRCGFWENERETAEVALAAAGFTIREHAQTGGPRHEVVVDQPLVTRVAECERKIEQHTSKANEYAQWAPALAAAGDAVLTLDFADWMFFFGLRGDEDE
jgi:hypothetical protein